MANPSWPETLPPPNYGLQSGGEDNAVRTSMDAGPRKSRRRYTRATETVKGSLDLTDAQAATLLAFAKDTLKDVLPFDWEDFISGEIATYVFIGRPRFTRVSFDNVRAEFTLETRP